MVINADLPVFHQHWFYLLFFTKIPTYYKFFLVIKGTKSTLATHFLQYLSARVIKMETIILSLLGTTMGFFLGRFKLIKPKFPRSLGRSLYRFGLPLQIFVLAHNTTLIKDLWFPPFITILVLILGLILAGLNLFYGQQLGHVIVTKYCPKTLFSLFSYQTKEFDLPIPQHSSGQGSFILASTLGSTGYLGLSIVPLFVSSVYSGWAVLYSITQILFGSFGMGVLLANYYGSPEQQIAWSIQLQELIRVPALWAFLLGWCSRSVDFSLTVDWQLKFAVSLVIAAAFLLTGIQIQEIKQVHCLNWAIIPTLLKMLVIPGLTGLCLTWFGFTGDARLSMVLMSGMPTANTNLILAEEYNLDRQVTASTIALSTILLPVMIMVWKYLLA
jgi:malate permease and related proteins